MYPKRIGKVPSPRDGHVLGAVTCTDCACLAIRLAPRTGQIHFVVPVVTAGRRLVGRGFVSAATYNFRNTQKDRGSLELSFPTAW